MTKSASGAGEIVILTFLFKDKRRNLNPSWVDIPVN